MPSILQSFTEFPEILNCNFFLSSFIITLINCICHQLHLAEPFTFPHINGIMCHRFLQINTRKPWLITYCREIMWRYMKSWNETLRSRWKIRSAEPDDFPLLIKHWILLCWGALLPAMWLKYINTNVFIIWRALRQSYTHRHTYI